MKKSKSINFYPDDFLAGTFLMSLEARGAYMTLMCLQSSKHLSTDEIRAALGDRFDAIWAVLSCKFKQDDEGNWFNERWESEVEARQAYVQRQKENGNKGGRPRKSENPEETHGFSKTKPMGFENHNPNESLINRIEYNSNGNTEDKGIVSVSSRGDTRGEDRPTFYDALYMRFIPAYGVTGRAVQTYKVQEALRDAVQDVIQNVESMTLDDAATFLCECAKAQKELDAKQGNTKRLDPQNWLNQRCYTMDISKAEVRGASQSAKMTSGLMRTIQKLKEAQNG